MVSKASPVDHTIANMRITSNARLMFAGCVRLVADEKLSAKSLATNWLRAISWSAPESDATDCIELPNDLRPPLITPLGEIEHEQRVVAVVKFTILHCDGIPEDRKESQVGRYIGQNDRRVPILWLQLWERT